METSLCILTWMDDLDPPSIFVAGGRLAIVILVVFSYPLQAHPCRASLDKILAWRTPEARGLKVPPPPSAIKYFIMTTAILIGSYALAITVTQLDVVCLATFSFTHILIHPRGNTDHLCRYWHLLDQQDRPQFHSFFRGCSITRSTRMTLGNQARLRPFVWLSMEC